MGGHRDLPDDKKLDHLYAPWNWEDFFHNSLEEEDLTAPTHKYLRDSNDGLVIWGIYHVRAVCECDQNIHMFPFDRQAFDMSTTIDRNHFEILFQRPKEWVAAKSEGLTILGNNNDQLFQLNLSVTLKGKYIVRNPVIDYTSNSDKIVLLRIAMERVDDFYWMNIFIPLFFIVLASFSTVSIELRSADERLNTSITMFLVVVAFQYSARGFLPQTDQVSIMDIYVLSSVIMTFAQIAESGLMNFLITGADDATIERLEYIDYCFYGLALVIWIVIHILLKIIDTCFSEKWSKVMKRNYHIEKWLPLPEDQPSIFGGENETMMGLWKDYELYTLDKPDKFSWKLLDKGRDQF